jgi:hypothetical protein
MNENGPVREVKLRILSSGYACIRPGHPGMSVAVRVEEDCPLGQIRILLTKRVFDGPVHPKSELSLPALDINPFLISFHFV